MSLLLLNEDELRQIVTINEAIASVEVAFAALAAGKLDVPGNFAMQLPNKKGEVQVKGAYLHETPYYVINIRSNFYNNPAINLPAHSSLIAVFEAATGFPAAIMVDNGYLSTIRTGAVGALAAKYLANQDLNHVAVIGLGDQAYMQLKALTAVRTIGMVLVWAHSPASADHYARHMVEDHDVNIEITASIEAAARPADLIIVAAQDQQPLIKAEWLKKGVHITAVGSTAPTPPKLHVDVLKRADVIVSDNITQSAITGEIHHALEAKIITQENVQGELSELIAGKIPGRTRPDQITVADLTGLEPQDSVVATLALEKALFYGLGQHIESRL